MLSAFYLQWGCYVFMNKTKVKYNNMNWPMLKSESNPGPLSLQSDALPLNHWASSRYLSGQQTYLSGHHLYPSRHHWYQSGHFRWACISPSVSEAVCLLNICPGTNHNYLGTIYNCPSIMVSVWAFRTQHWILEMNSFTRVYLRTNADQTWTWGIGW